MAKQRENRNPYSAFNFVVEIGTEGEVAGFQEITGLDSENTPIEYREGGDPMNTVRKLPGIERYPNITLKRGMTGSLYFWEWRKEVRDGSGAYPPVRDVVIHLQNDRHERVYKWKLTNAWCTKLTGPTLNATGNEIAVETLELAYDRIDNE